MAKNAEVGLSSTHPELAITGDYPVYPCTYKLRPDDMSGRAFIVIDVDVKWLVKQTSRVWVYLRDADGLLAWWRIEPVAHRENTVSFSG
jgi:hypothetical protein